LLGREFNLLKQLKIFETLPYNVVEVKGQPRIEMAIISGWAQMFKPKFVYFTPEEITAKLIKKLKTDAERLLNRAVTHAVVTVPAYFNDVQRQTTKDACTMAGLTCLRVVNEPIAAAISHGLDMTDREAFHIVYDVRANGVDVTLLSVEWGIYEIIGSVYESILSPSDFDEIVWGFIVDHFIDKNIIQSENDIENIDNLKTQVKTVQGALLLDNNGVPDNTINVKARGVTTISSLTQTQVLAVRDMFLRKTIDLVDKVLKQAKISKSDLLHIVPIGPLNILRQAQPIFKEYFEGNDVTMLFSSDFNPDEAIVRGAAIQGNVLGSGEDICPSVMDVTTLSLGIELSGGTFGKIIPRNTVIPTWKSFNITTVRDGQEKIVLNIYEGERSHVRFNKFLTTLEIEVPKKLMGEPVVELSFEVDPDRYVTVQAQELSSGNVVKVALRDKDSEPVTQEEIYKIIMEAEEEDSEGNELEEADALASRAEAWRKYGAVLVSSLAYRDSKKLKK